MSEAEPQPETLWVSFVSQAKASGKSGDIHGVIEEFRERVLKKNSDLTTEHRRQIGKIFHGLAEHLISKGELRSAATAYDEAERYYREVDEKDLLQRALGQHSHVLMHVNDVERATSVVAERVQICREIGDQEALLSCLTAQTQILHWHQDDEHVAELVEQQEELAREIGGDEAIGSALMNRGLSLVAAQNLDEAKPLLEEAVKRLRQGSDRKALANAIGSHGVLLWQLNDLPGALALQKEAAELCRELKDKEGLAKALAMQALVLAQKEDKIAALPVLQEADRIARAAGFSDMAEQVIAPIYDMIGASPEPHHSPSSAQPAGTKAPTATVAAPEADGGPALTIEQSVEAARMLAYLRTTFKGLLDAGNYDMAENLASEMIDTVRQSDKAAEGQAALAEFIREVREAKERAGTSASAPPAPAPIAATAIPQPVKMHKDVNRAVMKRLLFYPDYVQRGDYDRALILLAEAYELTRGFGQQGNADFAIRPAMERVRAMKGPAAPMPQLGPDSPVMQYITAMTAWQRRFWMARLVTRKPQAPGI